MPSDVRFPRASGDRVTSAAPSPKVAKRSTPTVKAPTGIRRLQLWVGGPVGIKLISLAVFGLAWESAARASGSMLLAPLSSTIVAFLELILSVEFWAAMLDSFSALIVGLTVAVVTGVAFGAILGYFRTIGSIGILYTIFFMAVPMSALIPVVVVFAGIDIAARATVVFLFAFFEIAWNTHLGVRQADRSLIEMAYAFGAPRWKMFTRILVPGAAPATIAGIRLGTGRAFIGMVSAELLLASVGIGLLIKRYQSRFQAPELFATILFLLVAAALVQFGLAALERRLLRRFAP